MVTLVYAEVRVRRPGTETIISSVAIDLKKWRNRVFEVACAAKNGIAQAIAVDSREAFDHGSSSSLLRSRCVACFLVLRVPVSVAQDEKVVPVHEEPRHRLVFEAPATRILDVQIPAGDTTLFHTHSDPILYVSMSQSQTQHHKVSAASGRVAIPRGVLAPSRRPVPLRHPRQPRAQVA